MSNAILTEIEALRGQIIKISVSSPVEKTEEYFKILLKPLKLKEADFWQAERFKGEKVFHLNVSGADFSAWFTQNVLPRYQQICIFSIGATITFFLAPSGKIKRSEIANDLSKSQITETNNRAKEYILSEGEDIPALVDLGVFTYDYKIVKSKYDKFKQINRFIEIVDDYYQKSDKKEITILDFGCGKSYLTFIIYYYFVKIQGIKAKIIGYDLKRDVVENCNKIAKKYGYDGLEFFVSDVTKDVLYEQKIDMVVTLHACDTATDYALHYAISRGVKTIFSVPCCQHEINLAIKKGGEYDLLLEHGLIKERFSALLTDSIRGEILEAYGYAVDMLEFVDFEHSPKNLMIRAKKTKKATEPNLVKLANISAVAEKYRFKQTLLELTKNTK